MVKKNLILFVIFVFIIAFSWELFFTYGFDFFWEDFGFYRLDKEQYPLDRKVPSIFVSELKVFQGLMKEFFAPQRLFRVGLSASYVDRPYQYLTWDALIPIFGDKAILYRIFKAIIFALNACFIFILINRVSRLMALLGVLLYISSAEVWLAVAYSSDVGIYAQCAVIISVFLFLKLLDKKPSLLKDIWFYYFFILLISNYAVLAKGGEGRYLAVMFLLTILFFRRQQLRLHLAPLLLLLIMQVPVLGYARKIFTGESFLPVDITTYPGILPIPQSLKLIAKNYIFPRNALGLVLLVLLFVIILTHLYSVLFRRKLIGYKKTEPPDHLIKERLFLFMLWFIFTLTGVAFLRSFNYDGPYNWSLFDFSYCIAPFIIFLCYYILFVCSNIKSRFYSRFLLICCVIILIGQIPLNLVRLNRFRGGWGNYFCAWHNVEKYIDKTSDNALALSYTRMRYKPFVFRHSNNISLNDHKIMPQFHKLDFIETKFKEEGYKDIFVAGVGEIKFEGKSEKIILVDFKTIDGDSADLYDRFKRAISRPGRSIMFLYHFKQR